ncbi:MAG: hypothetical protein V4525_16220 [Pseudomonadota bacterium]
MSKGQKKGNKELKKPKQEKQAVVPVSSSIIPSSKKPLPTATSKTK